MVRSRLGGANASQPVATGHRNTARPHLIPTSVINGVPVSYYKARSPVARTTHLDAIGVHLVVAQSHQLRALELNQFHLRNRENRQVVTRQRELAVAPQRKIEAGTVCRPNRPKVHTHTENTHRHTTARAHQHTPSVPAVITFDGGSPFLGKYSMTFPFCLK